MKKLVIIIIASLAVCACSTLTSAQRAERDAKTAQAVEKALTERQYTVDIQMMYPRCGKAEQLETVIEAMMKWGQQHRSSMVGLTDGNEH